MTPRVKRILVLFSLFLNIGFCAAAAYHIALPHHFISPKRALDAALTEMKVSPQQHKELMTLESTLHINMRDWWKQTYDLKMDNVNALTLPNGPDINRLNENLEKELSLLKTYNLKNRKLFIQSLSILGPEKSRELALAMLHKIRRPR